MRPLTSSLICSSTARQSARHQRKYLVGIPCVLMFLCGTTFGTSGYLVFVEGMKSNAATAVQEHSYLVQLAIIMLCFTMVCLCASSADEH